MNKFDKLTKRTILDELKYQLYYRPVRYLDMLPRRIYWFFQRGYRGYADNDTWDFDNYLATVIVGGLKQIKTYHQGLEPTNKELTIIIKGFEANLKMMDNLNPKSKEYLILKDKFHKGIVLFEKYFNYLWD